VNSTRRFLTGSRPFWSAALCLLAGLVVAGCGSSSSSSSSGNTLVVASPDVPATLDMEFAQASDSGMVYRNAYGSLIQFPITQNASGVGEQDVTAAPVCLMCTSFSYRASPPAWLFTLKQGVKSPFGNELTAQDVQWSFQRSVAIGVALGGLNAASVNLKDPITVTGPFSFTVNLTQPNPLFPEIFAVPNLNAPTLDAVEVKKHATASDPWAKSWLATHTAGFGPLQVKSFDPGNQVTWIPNPNYFGAKPALAKIIYKAVPNDATRTELLQAGAVDVALDLTPQDLATLKHAPGVAVDDVRSVRGIYFGLNNKDAPFNDVLVRQAIAYASPVPEMAQSLFLGDPDVRQTGGYLPEEYPGALTGWPYAPNLAKAKQLLREAHVGKFSFELTISSSNPIYQDMAEMEKSALAPLGITVVINVLPPALYQQEFFSRKTEAELVEDQANIPDGPYALTLYFSSGPSGVADWANYNNPTVNHLLQEGMNAQSPAARAQYALEAHKIIVSQAPWAFALFEGYDLARRTDVHGFVWTIDSLLWLYPFTKS
jgi:peptide/nickel transport system substrate-binding protein